MNRRFLLLCVAMCLMGIVPMKAQIGILLGFDQSINRTKIGSEATFQKKPALNGFKAGVFYEHNFKYGLGLYYGVNYNFLHDKTKWEGQGNGWFLRTATTLHNLDFPIHFQYKLSIAKDTYLMAYTGPTLALGLAGTEAEQLLHHTSSTEEQRIFQLLHASSTHDYTTITPYFRLQKQETDFTQLQLPPNSVDIIFFDAFSPEKQPEMWTQERFDMLYLACRPNAVLTTYCAKGVVRRTMQQAGFTVERLPGPPGKREILRATKKL